MGVGGGGYNIFHKTDGDRSVHLSINGIFFYDTNFLNKNFKLKRLPVEVKVNFLHCFNRIGAEENLRIIHEIHLQTNILIIQVPLYIYIHVCVCFTEVNF